MFPSIVDVHNTVTEFPCIILNRNNKNPLDGSILKFATDKIDDRHNEKTKRMNRNQVTYWIMRRTQTIHDGPLVNTACPELSIPL